MVYRILCVDDEEMILDYFRRAFENTDYMIHTAKNGVDAIEQVKKHRPHIVFLDVVMPDMRGDEVLPLIHQIDPDIAVIMVSGRVSEEEARDLLHRGAYDFHQKPIDLQHLVDLVEQWRFQRESS